MLHYLAQPVSSFAVTEGLRQPYMTLRLPHQLSTSVPEGSLWNACMCCRGGQASPCTTPTASSCTMYKAWSYGFLQMATIHVGPLSRCKLLLWSHISLPCVPSQAAFPLRTLLLPLSKLCLAPSTTCLPSISSYLYCHEDQTSVLGCAEQTTCAESGSCGHTWIGQPYVRAI